MLGQAKEHFFQLRRVHFGIIGFDALLQSSGDDVESGAVDGFGRGGKLGDNVLTVPFFFDHADYSIKLTAGALETVEGGSERSGVELHGRDRTFCNNRCND